MLADLSVFLFSIADRDARGFILIHDLITKETFQNL